MTHPVLRWLLPILRYGLCAAAIVYLYTKVSWYDKVRLNDAARSELRLIEQRGDDVFVLRDGQRVAIPLTQVARLDEGVLDIEYGIGGVVHRLDTRTALWALLLFAPAPLLQSLRLVWMLAIQAVRISFWDAAKLTFAGNFFNFALPGTTGGDLIKAYYITRFTHRKTEAVTTVFLDRVIGLLGLVLLAGAMIICAWDPRSFGKLAYVLAVVCAVLAVGALFVFSRRLRHAIGLPRLAEKLPAGEQLLRVGRATVAMRQHKGLLAAALLNTVVLQFLVMVSAFFMARALNMTGDFVQYLIYVPIGFLIAALPIAPPQGFGVMEYFYVQFFARTGMGDESQAVAFALAVRVIQLVWALPGVLVPLLGAHLPRQSEFEAMRDEDDQAAPVASTS